MLIETAEHLKEEMNRVRAASLGEVIMFAGLNQPLDHDHPGEDPLFKAVMGIYQGIHTDKGLVAGLDGEMIPTTLRGDFPVEMGIYDVHGIPASSIHETRDHNFSLGIGSQAFIGRNEITSQMGGNPEILLLRFVDNYIARFHDARR
jgi:hypothetical protein